MFGSTARASDIRIILSVVTNVGLICLAHYAIGGSITDEINTPEQIAALAERATSVTLALSLFAYVASHNVWHSLGLKKPFRAENPTLKKE